MYYLVRITKYNPFDKQEIKFRNLNEVVNNF